MLPGAAYPFAPLFLALGLPPPLLPPAPLLSSLPLPSLALPFLSTTLSFRLFDSLPGMVAQCILMHTSCPSADTAAKGPQGA